MPFGLILLAKCDPCSLCRRPPNTCPKLLHPSFCVGLFSLPPGDLTFHLISQCCSIIFSPWNSKRHKHKMQFLPEQQDSPVTFALLHYKLSCSFPEPPGPKTLGDTSDAPTGSISLVTPSVAERFTSVIICNHHSGSKAQQNYFQHPKVMQSEAMWTVWNCSDKNNKRLRLSVSCMMKFCHAEK